MARYIDLDRVIAILDNDIKTGDEMVSISWARSWLNSQPTVDVVPKSEVEQIKWERDVAIKQLEEIGLSFGEKTDGYGNLTEDAKQIFEEIEKTLNREYTEIDQRRDWITDHDALDGMDGGIVWT